MTQLHLDDVSPGQTLPPRTLGPIGSAHIVRWSAAMENWHRIHFDQAFARNHEGLADVLINGSWKQHILIRYLADWAGERGWLLSLEMQFRTPSPAWESLTCHGEILDCSVVDDWGGIEVRFGMRNADGTETAPGRATIILPLRGGPDVPCPFPSEVAAHLFAAGEV